MGNWVKYTQDLSIGTTACESISQNKEFNLKAIYLFENVIDAYGTNFEDYIYI